MFKYREDIIYNSTEWVSIKITKLKTGSNATFKNRGNDSLYKTTESLKLFIENFEKDDEQ